MTSHIMAAADVAYVMNDFDPTEDNQVYTTILHLLFPARTKDNCLHIRAGYTIVIRP